MYFYLKFRKKRDQFSFVKILACHFFYGIFRKASYLWNIFLWNLFEKYWFNYQEFIYDETVLSLEFNFTSANISGVCLCYITPAVFIFLKHWVFTQKRNVLQRIECIWKLFKNDSFNFDMVGAVDTETRISSGFSCTEGEGTHGFIVRFYRIST